MGWSDVACTDKKKKPEWAFGDYSNIKTALPGPPDLDQPISTACQLS